MDAATRRRVQIRAAHRCEYCRIHEDDEPYSFHIEHIIPIKHGGQDDLSNLAWHPSRWIGFGRRTPPFEFTDVPLGG